MNREEAIKASILKWEVLATTGEFRRYIKDITTDDMPHGCALCLLAGQHQYEDISRYRCKKYCPYAHKFGCCFNRSQPFSKWEVAVSRDIAEAMERRK